MDSVATIIHRHGDTHIRRVSVELG